MITLNLTQQQLNLVISALLELPAKVAIPVLNDIQTQASQQLGKKTASEDQKAVA